MTSSMPQTKILFSRDWTPLRRGELGALLGIFIVGIFLRWFAFAPDSSQLVAAGSLKIFFALFLFTATFYLLFDFARHAFSINAGLLAILLYSLTVSIAIQNPPLVAENVTTALFLLNLVALQRYEAKCFREWLFGIITILSIVGASFFRFSAMGQAAAIFFLLLTCGRKRETIYPIVGGAIGLLINLVTPQMRPFPFANFDAMTIFITNPPGFSARDFSYPLFVGWIALFTLAFRPRSLVVFHAPLIYLLFFAFLEPFPGEFAPLVFYPFLSLAFSVVILESVRTASHPFFIWVVVLLLPNFFNIIFLNHTSQSSILRLFYLIVVPLLLFLPLLRVRIKPKIRQIVILAMVILLLFDQSWAIWWARDQLAGDKMSPRENVATRE